MSNSITIDDWKQWYSDIKGPQDKSVIPYVKEIEYINASSNYTASNWKYNGNRVLFECTDTSGTRVVFYVVDPNDAMASASPTTYVKTAMQSIQSQNNYEWIATAWIVYTGGNIIGWEGHIKRDLIRNGTTTTTDIRRIGTLPSGYTIDVSYGGTLSGLLGYTPSENSVTLKMFCPTVDLDYALRKQLIDDYGSVPTGMGYQSLQGEFGTQASVRFSGKVISAIRSLEWTDGNSYNFEYSVPNGIVTPVEETDGDGSSYFYDCYTYSDNFAQTNKQLVYHKWGHIKTPSGCRCWGVVTNSLPYNVTLHTTSGFEFMGAIQNDGTFQLMRSLDVQITARKTVNDGNGVYYFGALSTNIPIFDSEEEGEHYGETGDDTNAIYDDVWNGSTTHRFGERIIKTQSNDYSISATGRPYCVVNTNGDKLVAWLGSERTQSIFADFTLWGNNPIDMVTDFYWTPIDVSQMGYTHSGDHFIKFGYVYAEDLNSSASEPYDKLTCNAKYHGILGSEHTLVNEVISGVYNDWRDYELFKFKLYLPFYGTIDLATHLILNKLLKVSCRYFISTHTLHYYIYVDSVCVFEYDVIVGCDLPLTGSDVVGKARDNLSAFGGDYGRLTSMGASAVRGDVVGAIDSGIGLMTSKILRDSATSLSTWGATSVTGNINDYTYCYMIIEEQQHYAPTNLHSVYNYPSYYIGTINNCSGYCEIDNVRLSGCTQFSNEEREKIKELLRRGVIL